MSDTKYEIVKKNSYTKYNYARCIDDKNIYVRSVVVGLKFMVELTSMLFLSLHSSLNIHYTRKALPVSCFILPIANHDKTTRKILRIPTTG